MAFTNNRMYGGVHTKVTKQLERRVKKDRCKLGRGASPLCSREEQQGGGRRLGNVNHLNALGHATLHTDQKVHFKVP